MYRTAVSPTFVNKWRDDWVGARWSWDECLSVQAIFCIIEDCVHVIISVLVAARRIKVKCEDVRSRIVSNEGDILKPALVKDRCCICTSSNIIRISKNFLKVLDCSNSKLWEDRRWIDHLWAKIPTVLLRTSITQAKSGCRIERDFSWYREDQSRMYNLK